MRIVLIFMIVSFLWLTFIMALADERESVQIINLPRFDNLIYLFDVDSCKNSRRLSGENRAIIANQHYFSDFILWINYWL